MKKLIALITLVVMLASVMVFMLSACNVINNKFDHIDTQLIYKKDGEDFVIIQFADIHLQGSNQDQLELSKNKSFQLIDYYIRKYQPDLVVMSGDNVSDSNHYMDPAIALTRFIDSYKIPWAPVLGNHEHGDYNRYGNAGERFIDLYENSEYCLFKHNPDLVYAGDGTPLTGNYTLTIMDGNNAIYNIFMMDIGTKMTSYFSDEQLNWYKNQTEAVSTAQYGENSLEEGKIVPSMVVVHIGVPEYQDAAYYALGVSGRGVVPAQYGSGENIETSESQSVNVGFFDMMKKYNGTHMFAGHRHSNSAIINYEGVTLAYGTKTGFNSAYEMDMIGAVKITIHNKTNKVTVEQLLWKDRVLWGL